MLSSNVLPSLSNHITNGDFETERKADWSGPGLSLPVEGLLAMMTLRSPSISVLDLWNQ